MPNGEYNHLARLHPLPSLPSLILLWFFCGLFASCGVWYLFMRLALKRKPTCATERQNTVPPKDTNKNSASVIAVAEEDEEQNIDIPLLPLDTTFIQPSGHKKRHYGNIKLSDPFKKSYGMQSWPEHVYAQNQNQDRRRSSCKSYHLDIEGRSMVDTQLADSPRSRLSSKAAQVSTENRETRHFTNGTNDNANANVLPSRPNRMWGPRANVDSKALRPPRTVSRTISFWKRTSILAMKYSDGAYLDKKRHYRVYVSQPESDATQHRERRRPLPHPPPLDLLPSSEYNDKHENIRNFIQSDITTRTATTKTTVSESAISNHSFRSGPFPINYNTNRLRTQTRHTSAHSSIYTYSEASSSILHTPGSEVSHLGMDALRASVDDKAGSFPEWLPYSGRPFDEVTMKMNDDQGIPIPAASAVVSRHRDNLGDPYVRVQKILEYAYRTSPLPLRQEQLYLQSHLQH